MLVFLAGIFSWQHTNKEELPDITFNTVRVSTSYPGASAEDVEFYVTKPLEEALQGLEGVMKITSTSSDGQSAIAIEIDKHVKNIDQIVMDIKTLTSAVELPNVIDKEPNVRIFETSKKAIIDIAIFHTNNALLSVQNRQELQDLSRGLENQLLAQNEIYAINRRGYLKEELSIIVDPKKIQDLDLSLAEIYQVIKSNHSRVPAGKLNSQNSEYVRLESALDNKQNLAKLIIHDSLDTKAITLSSVAGISDGFEQANAIYKVNGRQAIVLNVVKNSSVGILKALKKVKEVTNRFEQTALKNSSYSIKFLDDESYDVATRLNLLKSNGILGFCLILLTLLIFLNKRSAFWVALGLPFSLCFTLICMYFLGFTINGITLAAMIIVLGIVVDDAIIVAENITRYMHQGLPIKQAAVVGTCEVLAPICASILTTCAAFLPLFFFSGRFSSFMIYIPLVIFFMLAASVFESFLLLPSHMTLFPSKKGGGSAKKWFDRVELIYENMLYKLLKWRYLLIAIALIALFATFQLVRSEFKFVLFNNDESREVVISGIATKSQSLAETAHAIQGLEDFLINNFKNEAVGVRSIIGQGRRGQAGQENVFRCTLEIIPADQRQKSANQMINEIKNEMKQQTQLSKINYRKRRYGQAAGSAFEIIVQENNDQLRDKLVNDLMVLLEKQPDIINVEQDSVLLKKEYTLHYKQNTLNALSIHPDRIADTVRIGLSGKTLYKILREDEIDVKLDVPVYYKQNIEQLLNLPIANARNYLIPLNELVSVKTDLKKRAIRRENLKRSSFVYADLKPGVSTSPLEFAKFCEDHLFTQLLEKYPYSQLYFIGEVQDSKESKNEFLWGVIAAIMSIYAVLALLFNSLLKPLRVILIIPFGMIGVIVAFYLHQKTNFGFYAAVGTLGMLGVVVNDAIVMLDKFDKSNQDTNCLKQFTAKIAKTRLRAVVLTTLTTVAGVFPTAYGLGGLDIMLADMMLALAWGLISGTLVTLILTPSVYMISQEWAKLLKRINARLLLGAMCVMILFLNPKHLKASPTIELDMDGFVARCLVYDQHFESLLIQQAQLHYEADRLGPVDEYVADILSGLQVKNSNNTLYTRLDLLAKKPLKGQSYGLYVHVDPENTAQFSSGLQFSQDIAKNAFGKDQRLKASLISIQKDLLQYQLIEAYENYLSSLKILYYQWLKLENRHKLAQSSLAESQKVLQSVLKRQRNNIANQTDVAKVRLQVLNKEEQLIISKQQADQQKIHIAYAMGIKDISKIKAKPLEMADLIKRSQEPLKELDFSSIRSLKMQHLLQKQAGIHMQRAQRNLMPSLFWHNTFDYQKEQQQFYAQSYVLMNLPIIKPKEKAEAKHKSLTNDLQKAENFENYLQLEIRIQQAKVALQQEQKRLQLLSQKRQIAHDILKQEQHHYHFGKITLNDYMLAVNRYDTARLDELEQTLNYQQLYIKWQALTDSLVIDSKLTR